MSNVVIVAIPAEDDLVWQISSEKVPHLTLLFLGEDGSVQNVGKIAEFLEHAANTSLTRFYLDVDRRGTLGDDEADVVFFEGWDLPELKQFRGHLLQEPNISKAFLAAEQFPVWDPHLTLGYPKTPAKPPQDRYDRIHSVEFDRVALWIGNYEGPEFQLKRRNYMEVSMSDTVDDLLHYGVKGMKWGKRKDRSPTEVTVTTTKKGRVKTAGGANQPAHAEAVVARVAAQKAKKSGLDALSNQELQTLARRLELEQKVSKIGEDRISGQGRAFVKALMEINSKK